MPISRFVAVSLRPASSVRSRTFASTGRVLRLETARDTTVRPRARFSCMTESFTGGGLQQAQADPDGRPSARVPACRRIEPVLGGTLGGMIVLSSHPVIIIIMPWIAWTVMLVRAERAG